MDLQLAGKNALVTGASKGIGRAAAECLAAEGCNVILVSRTGADLAAAKEAIARKSKVQIRTVVADLSQSSAVDRLARDFPTIDRTMPAPCPAEICSRSTSRLGARPGI